MASLLHLNNSFNLSNEELVERWAENVVWQYFSGMDFYEPRLRFDATQIGRFGRLLGEDGIEQMLKATIDCAVQVKAVLLCAFFAVGLYAANMLAALLTPLKTAGASVPSN